MKDDDAMPGHVLIWLCADGQYKQRAQLCLNFQLIIFISNSFHISIGFLYWYNFFNFVVLTKYNWLSDIDSIHERVKCISKCSFESYNISMFYSNTKTDI